MESDDLSCLCGKIFAQQNALSNHKRKCQRSKQTISALLSKAKLAWQQKKDEKRGKKKRKLDSAEMVATGAVATSEEYSASLIDSHQDGGQSGSNNSTGETWTDSVHTSKVAGGSAEAAGSCKEVDVPKHDKHANDTHLTSNLPLALRRSRRPVNLPNRLKDMLPCSVAIRMAEAVLAQKDELRKMAEKSSQANPKAPSSVSVNNNSDSLLALAGVGDVSASHQRVQSTKNSFHMYRRYDGTSFPEHDPEDEITLEDLSDIQYRDTAPLLAGTAQVDFGPYPNQSCFLLGEWFWKAGHRKSKRDFRSLVDILTANDFNIDDLRRTPWESIDRCLGASSGDPGASESWLQAFNDAGWVSEEVSIKVPFSSRASASQSKLYSIGQFYRRSIVSVIRERIASSESRYLHLAPHEVFWQPDDEPALRVYGELYNSPAFIDAHREVNELPREKDCELDRVVIALMFASDETHLTQFGETKLWPLYMFLGNDSKYRRAKPSHHLCNHLAYFIKLPETFKEFVRSETGTKVPNSALLSHCLREALQAQWNILLDKDFMEAYEHGVVEECGFNGVKYRFYPRIFTYSADYKEKSVTLNSIRNLGNQPCPRCLVPKKEIQNLGLDSDSEWRTQRKRVDDDSYRQKINDARTAIYEHNYVVDSKKAVDSLLKEESLVPVQTAFTTKLAPYGFNFFEMSVVDLLHEIESGNWKSLFIQLLRILESLGDHLKIELDSRYRQVPTFGCEKIRKFGRNVSEMKSLAARDWEDMLQCAIPVFDGLLPEPHNSILLDLLFSLARWHGFAKLRIHTDATLALMDKLTSELGHYYRVFFHSTCSSFKTKELAKEATARTRRQQAQSKVPVGSLVGISNVAPELHKLDPTTAQTSEDHARDKAAPTNSEHNEVGLGLGTRRPKTLNMNTYKFHAMGDYTSTVRRFGTTDSYSTEFSELEHRNPKDRYSRTNKKDFIKQLVQIERRQARIRTIRRQMDDEVRRGITRRQTDPSPSSTHPASNKYNIGKSQNSPIFIPQFLHSNVNDVATKNFFNNLKAHLVYRLSETAPDSSALEEELPQLTSRGPPSTIFIQRDTMYSHKTLHLNYTTYDVRRSQDVVNPGRPSNTVMALSRTIFNEQVIEPVHPFVYGRVLGTYHVNVISSSTNADSERVDFLWVRWYTYHQADSPLRLDKLSFPPLESEGAFGFIDPSDVLRACHVIPCYAEGRRSPDRKSVSKLAQDGEDWKSYYIARFADRDLLMRFEWGMGIGHSYWFTSFSKEHRKLFQSSTPSATSSLTGMDHADMETEPMSSVVNEDYTQMEQSSDGECDSNGELQDRENDEIGSDAGSCSDEEEGSSDEGVY